MIILPAAMAAKAMHEEHKTEQATRTANSLAQAIRDPNDPRHQRAMEILEAARDATRQPEHGQERAAGQSLDR